MEAKRVGEKLSERGKRGEWREELVSEGRRVKRSEGSKSEGEGEGRRRIEKGRE